MNLFVVTTTLSQQTVNHHVNFATNGQNMWGPNFSPFTIDTTITLFEQGWNLNYDTGNAMIATVAGYSFGAALSGSFSGLIGSSVSLNGFTTGTLDADYPIDVTLDMPTDYNYNQGDVVTINTSYTVDPSAELVTYYPSVGEAKWGLYFKMAGGISAKLCAFACTTFPIIPNFDTGLIDINLITANASGLWFIGPAEPTDVVDGFINPGNYHPGKGIFPFSVDPKTTGPYSMGNVVPWQCHVPFFPFTIPDFGYGVTGEVTVPFINTTSVINGNNIVATGDSTYFHLNIEVFKLLGGILGNFKGPVAVVGQVLANLSGEQDLSVAKVSWNLFSASFDANLTNIQRFDFTPKIWCRFDFPVPVDYQIIDPINHSSTGWSTSNIINVQIGKNLSYKFPCYFETVNITPTYSIIGTIKNHTFDSISFDFLMSAFAFGFSIPAIEVIPSIHVPEICIPFPYPCPSWSKPWRWCTHWECTPEFTIPAVGWPGLDFSLGPLFEAKIPIGNIKYDWFNHTWDLDGFDDYAFSPFAMNANRLIASTTVTNVKCYGGNDGIVNLTLTNAKLPATFLWTNGSTNEDLTGLSGGAYEVTIIDSNNCQIFTGGTVLEPVKPLTVEYSKIDKKCNNGNDNGSIDITVTGGTSPYTYNWSSGQTSQNINNLGTGTYSVTVTDANNCTETISITINSPNLLDHFETIKNVNCNGGNDGAISIDVTGGALPYTYSWNSGQTVEDITNLTAGTYSLTITDANQCQSKKSHLVTQPSQPISISSIGTDVSCFGGKNGAINMTISGGTPNYSYNWANAQGIILPFQTEDISTISQGNYTITVTDSKGCKSSLSQLITQPIAPILNTPILTHINCYGDATGAINPLITGGTKPYSYNWSNGGNSAAINNLTAGNYSLILTDFNGCIEHFSYTLLQPKNALNIQLNPTNIKCFGEATGKIVSEISGGTSPYTYNWSNGATTKDITNLVAGSYSLTATDAKGCSTFLTTTLSQPIAPLLATSTIQNVDCNGNNTGAINLNVTGGTKPYRYTWSNALSFILSDTTQDLSNLAANTYNVLIKDNNNCTFNLSNKVTQPKDPLSNIGVIDDVNCYGDNDGSINSSTTGGTAPYNFSWSNGINTEDLSKISAGNYRLTIMDANGCSLSNNYSVTQPNAALSITTSTSNVLCFGGATGAISTEASGGTAPYTYLWSTGQTKEAIDHIATGNYSITITDAQGCNAFSGAFVAQPDKPLTVIPTVTEPSCFGYSDGSISVAISGGVQPYFMNWGNENEILLNLASETINNIGSNEYFIRIIDINECVNEQYITVNQPTKLLATSTLRNVNCNKDSTGSINLTITGGIPDYAIVWNTGQITEDLSNIPAGMYSYTITDHQNCKLTNQVRITENSEIILFNSTVESTSCVDQKDGKIIVNFYGGTMPYYYLWSNNDTLKDIQNLAPGNYSVIVSDSLTCKAKFSFEIQGNESECLDIPNTFTPNGDNYNDTWYLGNLDLYPNAEVKIFNKWGNLIYATSGKYIPWDGTFNNEPMPSAVFYYIIELKNSVENKYTGTVTIIR